MIQHIERILTQPTESLGRASRFLTFQVKLWVYCSRHLQENKTRQQAAALAYQTIFGLVPFTIVTVMVFQWFSSYQQVGQRVKDLVYQQLNLTTVQVSADANEAQASVSLTTYLDEIVGGFLSRLHTGAITLVSALVVVWAAVILLNTVERAFNDVWHVDRARPFLHRIINYWAILTLGPLLLGAGIFLATQHTVQTVLGHIQSTAVLGMRPQAFFSYGVTVVAFFLLYLLLPNTQVRPWPALWGGAVAAAVWTVAKWGFGLYVTKLIPYQKVYGVLGLIPLGVMWIYVSWLIVLFGAHVTYTTQNLKRLEAASIAANERRSNRFIASDVTILQIVREVGLAFETGQGPVSAEQIYQAVGLEPGFGQKLLSYLVEAGLLMKVSEPANGYTLARAPEKIRLVDISLAVAKASFANASPEQILDAQRLLQTQSNLKELLGDTKG
jgi:membrane protein